MKTFSKILSCLFIITIFSSCDWRDLIPKFDQKDAFVAFEQTQIEIEATDELQTLQLPFKIATINPISTTVQFEVSDNKDYPAKLGEDYSIESKSIKVDNARGSYVTIKILPKHSPEAVHVLYITITSADGLNIGHERVCTVVIK